MSYPSVKPCHCGSGLPPYELLDARGIYAGRVCQACEEQARQKFRPDVFTNPDYEHDEPIDPE